MELLNHDELYCVFEYLSPEEIIYHCRTNKKLNIL